ncbi:MAG: endonuclease MutS2 [Lachnospiraceae bacterium]
MNSKVLQTLEFHKILEQLAARASSVPGKERCLALVPSCDFSKIKMMQEQTQDALSRLFKNSSVSFSGSKDILAAIKRLEKGSTISAEELLQIAGLLENTNRIKAYSRKETMDVPDDSLDALFLLLEPLTPLSLEIRRCIISEEEISDEASPNLKQIRRLMRVTNDRIHSQLSSMVSTTYRTYLQDSVITMRNGRYCIPVKAEYKANVPGMIHDQSATASTFFIEPAAIVNLNNELRELELKEVKEIEVILASLSFKCSEQLFEIKQNLETLAELDFIFAKGFLAMEMNAARPVYNTQGRVRLRQARHPLLDKNKVVPIDMLLGDAFDLLIITGPNTGGKTVALKTLGLLSLMGQSGLHIPTLDRSELPVFSEIFADIGDEQSIEQSLSTFSSHMKNIVEILNRADEESLCLFDELGAGTDPTEGAALAIAVLSDLHARKIRTVATTHYSELKVFALKEPHVENACCEFNVETLRPTYRLLIGVPGKSNAFAISSKLGLPGYIIESAKSQISKKDESFEDVLSELEANRVTIEREKQQIAHYRQEIEALKQDFEKKQEKLNTSKDRIIREANEKAREILQEAKNSADEAIRNFQKYGSAGGNIQEMEKEREKLRRKLEKTQNNRPAPKAPAPQKQYKPSDFKRGESVKILSMGLSGTISSLPDAKGNLFVQCGIMRMQASMHDIEFIASPDVTGPGLSGKSKGSGRMNLSKSSTISSEINLLGLTVDEAIAKLDKYLDDAYLSHLSNVRVVHGKGTGALRSAIHTHLKKIRYIKSYRLAEYGEGDAGVTIVEFK